MKPVCYCSIALHPLAKNQLEEVYEVCEDEKSVLSAEASKRINDILCRIQNGIT